MAEFVSEPTGKLDRELTIKLSRYDDERWFMSITVPDDKLRESVRLLGSDFLKEFSNQYPELLGDLLSKSIVEITKDDVGKFRDIYKSGKPIKWKIEV